MRLRDLSVLLLVPFAASACRSTCCEACDNAQATVEMVARENPAVTRLTVHCSPANGGSPMACASTSAAKRGKPSDPEDVKAMQTGQTIVLEEGTAIDVTVPILSKDGRYTAVAGVTLQPGTMTREQTLTKAKDIAMAVEAGLKKNGECVCTCPAKK